MIPKLIQTQKDYFLTDETKSIPFRKAALKRLKAAVIAREAEIHKALFEDFKKPVFESILSETGLVLSELDLHIKKLKSWSKPKSVRPSLLNFPSSDTLYSEPYGTCLIIAPWNYPYQLAILPLIGAIAAGNTIVIKPSELTPATSALLKELLASVFTPEHVTVVEGGIPESQALLAERWDYIFFTGSVAVGKIVAKAAAEHLTPTTLELGGKNPCIIDASANIKLSAKRLAWGKFLNAGQTCIAPDYILIHKSIKQAFYQAFKAEIEIAYSAIPKQSEDFARIINLKNFKRLAAMLNNENCVIGGDTEEATLYISPTLIDEPSLDSAVMAEEIFGPILPVLSYETEEELEDIILNYDKPLSLYVFSKTSSFIKRVLQKYSFGGGAINDTMIHFGNHRLPFGGVGSSGDGAYHGKLSFDTFSHNKAIVKKGNWLDLPFRYAPYKGKQSLIKWVLKWF